MRKPKIAEMFYYTKNIDKWASGLQRISNECNTNNVAFEFTVLSNGFLTKFFKQTQEKTTLKTILKTDNNPTPKTGRIKHIGPKNGGYWEII